MAPSLHPAIDNGIAQGFGSFNGGTLTCKCPSDQVAVQITGDVAYNHACGCSKCWKPDGALFSVVGVVPVDKVKVVAHEEKLHIVDESAAIQRHACKQCGVHMYGRIVKDHPFKGFDFVHSELSAQKAGRRRSSRPSARRSSSKATSLRAWRPCAASSSRWVSTPTIAWRPA